MYPLLLDAHSVLRYVVLALLVFVIARYALGKIFQRQYNGMDDKLGLLMVMAVHLQFLAGTILYFISPLTTSALEDFSAAMKDEILRFWAVEHVTLMTLAVILITIGRVRAKKGLRSDERFRRAIIFYSLGLVLIIAGIPWERWGL